MGSVEQMQTWVSGLHSSQIRANEWGQVYSCLLLAVCSLIYYVRNVEKE